MWRGIGRWRGGSTDRIGPRGHGYEKRLQIPSLIAVIRAVMETFDFHRFFWW